MNLSLKDEWGGEERKQAFQSEGWTQAERHKDIKMLGMGPQVSHGTRVWVCTVVGAGGWPGDIRPENMGSKIYSCHKCLLDTVLLVCRLSYREMVTVGE